MGEIHNPKTVKDLIEVLQTLDPELVVGTTDCCYGFDDSIQVHVEDERIYEKNAECSEHGMVGHRHQTFCIIN